MSSTPQTGDTFGAQLRVRREAAGMSVAQLAARIGVHSNVIGYWENDTRTPKEDRQRVVLAAIESPSRAVAELVAQLQADVAARIHQFGIDVETVTAAPLVPALAELEGLTSAPAAAESAPRVRRRRAQ